LIYLHGSYYFSTFIHIICCLQVTLKGINLRSSCLYRIKTESHLFNHFKIKRHKRCIHLIWFKKNHVIIYNKIHVYLFNNNNNNNNNMKESRLTVICMTIVTELATRTCSLIQFQKELHWLGRTPAMKLWTIQSNYNHNRFGFFMTLNPSNKVQEDQREGGSIFHDL
jgi:hypothetical protein